MAFFPLFMISFFGGYFCAYFGPRDAIIGIFGYIAILSALLTISTGQELPWITLLVSATVLLGASATAKRRR